MVHSWECPRIELGIPFFGRLDTRDYGSAIFSWKLQSTPVICRKSPQAVSLGLRVRLKVEDCTGFRIVG